MLDLLEDSYPNSEVQHLFSEEANTLLFRTLQSCPTNRLGSMSPGYVLASAAPCLM